jgi:hypothetical protein
MVIVMVLVLFAVTLLSEDFGRRPSPPGANRSLS